MLPRPCALIPPVLFHCATKCFCERFAINAVTMIDSGTVATAIKASSGEIHSIITRMPRTVITGHDQLAERLLQALRDVVDVIGHA